MFAHSFNLAFKHTQIIMYDVSSVSIHPACYVSKQVCLLTQDRSETTDNTKTTEVGKFSPALFCCLPIVFYYITTPTCLFHFCSWWYFFPSVALGIYKDLFVISDEDINKTWLHDNVVGSGSFLSPHLGFMPYCIRYSELYASDTIFIFKLTE